MRYLAACTLHSLGTLRAGEEGTMAMAAADAYFTSEGVAKEACLPVSAPGFAHGS